MEENKSILSEETNTDTVIEKKITAKDDIPRKIDNENSDVKNDANSSIEKIASFKDKKKVLIIAVAAIIVIALLISILTSKKGQIEITSTATLEKVLEINQLETFEYPYRAVASVKNEKGKELYNVLYDAQVVISFDLTNTIISIDDKEKTVTIALPEAEMKYNIKYENMSFMNEGNKGDLNDARKAVKEDIESKLHSEKEKMIDIATDNAKTFVELRTKTIVNALDDTFKVIVK